MLVTTSILPAAALALYIVYRIYSKQEEEIEDSAKTTPSDVGTSTTSDVGTSTTSDVGTSTTSDFEAVPYTSDRMRRQRERMMREEVIRNLEPVAHFSLSEFEEGFGVYSETEIDGFIPFIKAGYGDDARALLFAELLNREIAYVYDTGYVKRFESPVRVYEFETAPRNPDAILEIDKKDREMARNASRTLFGKRLENLNVEEMRVLSNRVSEEVRSVERDGMLGGQRI